MDKKGKIIGIVLVIAVVIGAPLHFYYGFKRDRMIKAELPSVATLYDEIFSAGTPGALCAEDRVQKKLDTIFEEAKAIIIPTTSNNNQYQYLGTDADTLAPNTRLRPTTKNGCVSNENGEWVVWAGLALRNEKAWCIDYTGENGKIYFHLDGNDDIDIRLLSSGALAGADCTLIGTKTPIR